MQRTLYFRNLISKSIFANVSASNRLHKISARRNGQLAYLHNVGAEPLNYRNLGEQLKLAMERHGGRTALISCAEQKKFNFHEAGERALHLVHTLHKLGMRRGEHLGIWAPNTVQWYVTFLASVIGGFPLVCLNPAWQAGEVEYALMKGKTSVLVTMDECGKQNFHDILRELAPMADESTTTPTRLPDLRAVLMQMQSHQRSLFMNYHNALRPVGLPSLEVQQELLKSIDEIPPESPCSIQFTSGTTGQPKAAVLTHFSYANEGYYFGKSLRLDEGHKRVCLTVPFFHAFGLGIVMASLVHGSTLVLPSANFNGGLTLDAVERERCNVVVGTATMFIDMLEQQQKSPRELSSLDLGLVGGSACPPDIFRKCRTILGITDMRIGYGMTESSAAVFAQDGTESEEQTPHTVGKLYPHMEAKVVNAKGQTVAFGQPGELCLRGYLKMRGYMDDAEKTAEATTVDGWLRTGDEFVLEPSGIGRIVGRQKDMIIRGGENIYPKEIEDFLQTHPDVIEAQVVGVPDERMGEEISAWLRLKADAQTLTAESLKQFCHGKIAHFKIPRYVRIVDDFPKTNSGKIQKFKLQEMFSAKQ